MRAIQRMAFVIAVVAGVAVTGAPEDASAQQKFPAKPIRILTGGVPGSTPDLLARLIGNKMSDNWGQPVVIDYRPGIISASMVAKSAADGYTLLQAAPSIAIRATLMPDLPYDTLRDFAGVTEIGYSNILVVAAPGLGVKSVKELVAYAEARPGKVFFATGPAGSGDHINVEAFKFAAGIKAQHVSFKGSAESLIEIVAGRSHFSVTGLTVAAPFIKDGKLVALAQLMPGLPGVPLAADVVPQWKQMGSQAILAPAGTPLAIRQQIGKEVARILSLPDIRERLNAVAFHIAPTTPEEHERKLRADIAAFAKIIKDIGLRPN